MPPLTPSRTLKGDRLLVDFRGLRLFGGLRLLRLRRRGRTVTPIDELVVELLQRNAGRLALAGLDLGAGAPHELLGPAGGDEHPTELAVHRRLRLLFHRKSLLGGYPETRIAAGRIDLERGGTPVLKVSQNLLHSGLHALSPVAF